MPPNSFPDVGELRVDAFLVSNLANIRYLTGFTGSNALLIVRHDGGILFTDPRYDIQAAMECSCATKTVKGPLEKAVAAEVRRRRMTRLGFERNRISYNSYAFLKQQMTGVKLVPVMGAVERLRTIKSPEEIAMIRRSVEANSKAFAKATARIKATMTESELAAELEYQMRRHGAEKPAFDTIVAAGPKSALPHAQPGPERLGTGRLLLVDMGAMLEGYSSDMTRMLHLGKAAPKARKLYRAVLESQLAALDRVRAGVTAGDVDRAARKVLRRHGMDKLFIHSTGHGLGLEIHEAPRLARKEKTVLEAGMAITIEPGAYIEGYGGVRIEDTVVVTPAGCEILTPTPKELTEI